MFLTKAACSYETTSPLLSHHSIPIHTSFCQTTFAHLCQRAAGFGLDYNAAFESDLETGRCYRETQKHQPMSKHTRMGKTFKSRWHADTHTHANKSMNAIQGFFSTKHIYHETPLSHTFQLLSISLHCSSLFFFQTAIVKCNHNIWTWVMFCPFMQG